MGQLFISGSSHRAEASTKDHSSKPVRCAANWERVEAGLNKYMPSGGGDIYKKICIRSGWKDAKGVVAVAGAV